MAESTIASSPMRSRVVLLTGGTSGIGAAAAHSLACQGATLVIVGRDPRRCTRTVRRIRRACGHDRVHALVGDLSRQSDVRRIAAEFRSRFSTLDVLVNNAGALFARRVASADGLEKTFALNHLAYFLLTLLLADLLAAAPEGRVIVVASHAHEGVVLDFDDLQCERRYDRLTAYGRSKLANMLFAAELARRFHGTRVTVNAMTPGSVATRLGSNNGWLKAHIRNCVYRARGSMISPAEGAATLVYLATSPEVRGFTGRYYRKGKAIQPAPAALEGTAAARLWAVSEELTQSTWPVLLPRDHGPG